MKNLKLIILFLVALSVFTISCKKTEDEQAEDIINTMLDVKGSINLNVDGVTYNKLFSSVVFSESDQMVSFWAYDLDSEDSFVVSFGQVPAVGSTGVIDYESSESMTFMIIGSFYEGGGYFAQSGTIQRTSTDKYEIDVTLIDTQQTSAPISITGSVTVGEHN